jgi:hypothetical protein
MTTGACINFNNLTVYMVVCTSRQNSKVSLSHHVYRYYVVQAGITCVITLNELIKLLGIKFMPPEVTLTQYYP